MGYTKEERQEDMMQEKIEDFKQDIKEFIKRQLDYQDLKIELTQKNEDLNIEEKNLIISTCLDNKMKIKQDAGDELI